jgi:hypothetical protein
MTIAVLWWWREPKMFMVFRRAMRIGLLFAAASMSLDCNAADLVTPVSLSDQSTSNSRLDSILFFGGRMSTTDIWSSLAYNLNQTDRQSWDNNFVGAAYRRDVYFLGYGVVLGAEVGVGDRFGRYALCCNAPFVSSGIVQSGELWSGVNIREEGINLFDQVHVAIGITVGLSATTASIGHERQNEIDRPGSARLLVYLGPEIAFSMPSNPQLELVFREQHRSGAYGTFGHMVEGYNGETVGIRYRF